MPRIGLRTRAKPVNPCQILCAAGVERLEQRSLFSAYVFHDALSGLGVPSVIAENGPPLPPQGVAYERYGHGAIALGDLDLDGFGDYAVSAPGLESLTGQGSTPGAVFVRSGQTGDLLYALGDGVADFGISLARMGDLDADGLEDFAIGSPRFDGSANAVVDPAGRVWVFSGAAGNVITTFDGFAPDDEFGAAIAGVPDISQDGLWDLLVGAPGANGGTGEVRILTTVGPGLLWTQWGSQLGERFGSAMAVATSATGVVAIGAPMHDGIEANIGAVRVFEPGGALLYERTGQRQGDEFGASVAIVAGITALGSPTHRLVVGVPGADDLTFDFFPSYVHSGVAADRGIIQTFFATTGELIGRQGGTRTAGARFGQVVANVGDIDGDGVDDIGVLSPGAGNDGSAAFFRHTSNGLASFAAEWDLLVPDIGIARLTSVPGRGIGAVGDVNNDGFPDILLGDSDSSAAIAGAYALGGPLPIDGASDNLRYAWSEVGQRQFLIVDGEIRTYAKVPGLIHSAPGDLGSSRSNIQGISNSGVIVFINHAPTIPESPSGLLVLQNGAGVPLADLVVTIEGAETPEFSTLQLTAIGNTGHLLLTGSRVWIYNDGVITLTPLSSASDINSAGMTVGRLSISGESVVGTWSRNKGFSVIQGLETAQAINDAGVVAGVLAGTRTDTSPGNLATWHSGEVTDLGGISTTFASGSSARWVIDEFDVAGRILADLVWHNVRTNDELETYLFEPETGTRQLLDITHGFTVTTGIFGSIPSNVSFERKAGSALGPDGRIIAYNAVLAQVSDEAPWVLRADSPAASISDATGHYSAGINQFGELVLFRKSDQGWSGERLSTRLVERTNSNLIMFSNPGEGGAAFLVLADGGQMEVYSLTGETSVAHNIMVGRPAHETAIVGKLTSFTNSGGVVHLVGLDSNGDLVIYFLYSGSATTTESWGFDNLSQTHLAARGEETPAFVSNLTAFSTAWGTMHIAGLDAEGHVQIVWWGADSPLWRLQDLTATSVNPTDMQGSISAFVTAWGTLHINGADEQGRVVALWWAPGFFGNWRFDQLAPNSSVQLIPGTLTTYVTPWGGLNVVGRETVSGRATAYWWSPESNVWTVEVLRVQGDVPGPRLAGPVSANAAASETLSVYSRALDGHSTRLYWNPGDGGIWTVEDLTLLALEAPQGTDG
jgi:hypothetical protein